MMTSVANVLGLNFGVRKGGVERAASKAMKCREEFDKRAAAARIAHHPPMAGTPLQVGESVLCRGQPAELASGDEARR